MRAVSLKEKLSKKMGKADMGRSLKQVTHTPHPKSEATLASVLG